MLVGWREGDKASWSSRSTEVSYWLRIGWAFKSLLGSVSILGSSGTTARVASTVLGYINGFHNPSFFGWTNPRKLLSLVAIDVRWYRSYKELIWQVAQDCFLLLPEVQTEPCVQSFKATFAFLLSKLLQDVLWTSLDPLTCQPLLWNALEQYSTMVLT